MADRFKAADGGEANPDDEVFSFELLAEELGNHAEHRRKARDALEALTLLAHVRCVADETSREHVWSRLFDRELYALPGVNYVLALTTTTSRHRPPIDVVERVA